MAEKDLPKHNLDILLQLVGGKWKLLIVEALLVKNYRFVELKKKLGCTAKVLTACLKEMENEDLVIKSQVLKTNISEYSLTEIGLTLSPVIDVMQKWGKDYKKLQKLMKKYNI